MAGELKGVKAGITDWTLGPLPSGEPVPTVVDPLAPPVGGLFDEAHATTSSKLQGKGDGSGTATFDRGAKLSTGKTARLLDHFTTPDADWARLELASGAVIRRLKNSAGRATRMELMVAVTQALTEHQLEGPDGGALIDRLMHLGVLRRESGGHKRYALNAPPEEVAVKLADIEFFRGRLSDLLTQVRKAQPEAKLELIAFLSRAARAAEEWPRYPVESRQPFLKAIAALAPGEQGELGAILAAQPKLRHWPLIDSALLLLKDAPPEDWVKSFAPRLAGSAVYTVASEGWFAAGGLGRVQQYHSAGMKRLTQEHTRIATIEPYYAQTSSGQAIDYAALPTPVKDLQQVDQFSVRVAGKPVSAQVFRGTNEYGIEVYLIRDSEQRLTKGCYAYDRDGTGSWEDFSEFFSRASLELIRRLEAKEKDSKQESYKPPAIIANDGQLAPMVPFFRESEAKDPALSGAAIWMVTHTYKNRRSYSVKAGDDLLARWQIPNQLRADFWRISEVDVTSAGVRLADGASAVAAIHRDEVAHIDPQAELVAITNADNRPKSSAVFRKFLAQVDPAADPEAPPPASLIAAKRLAKIDLGLDPDQPVISYSGRLVAEKAGLDRAFTRENVLALVASGAQLVHYGNVQAFAGSEKLGAALAALAKELDQKRPAMVAARAEENQARAKEGLAPLPPIGRFVFKPQFGLADQIRLLAATDLQVQDSDRRTGASEYTEADVTANGGLQMGPPWIEGMIQRNGRLLDWSKPGVGNIVIPQDAAPKSYLAAMQRVIDLYFDDRPALGQYQVDSIGQSRPLSELLTGAEYLRQLDRVLAKKSPSLDP
jgi:hypothetical protein